LDSPTTPSAQLATAPTPRGRRRARGRGKRGSDPGRVTPQRRRLQADLRSARPHPGWERCDPSPGHAPRR